MDRMMIARRLLRVARTLVGATYLNYNEKVMDKPGTKNNFSGRLEFGRELKGEVKDATFAVRKRNNGTFYVDWESGTWVKGTCSCGIWKSGTFMEGTFRGTWRGGRFCGDFLAGSFEGGVMDGGKVYEGVKLGDRIRWIKGYEMKMHPGGGSMYDPVYHRNLNPKYWDKENLGNAVEENGNLDALNKAVNIIVDKEYVDFNGRINVGGLDGVASGNAHFHIRKDGSSMWFGGDWNGSMTGCEWHDGKFEGGSFDRGVFKGGDFNGGVFKGGSFEGGKFCGDEFKGGVFRDGTFEDGWFEGGTFDGGTWVDNEPEDWKGGTWKKGRDRFGRSHGEDDSPDGWDFVEMTRVSGEQVIDDFTFKCRNATFAYDRVNKCFPCWESGSWLDGDFSGGEFKSGYFLGGNFLSGVFGGTMLGGTMKGGSVNGGIWEEGYWQGGHWISGKDAYGIVHKRGDDPSKWNLVAMEKVSGVQTIGDFIFECNDATFVYDANRERFLRWDSGDWLDGEFNGDEWLSGNFLGGTFEDGCFRGGKFKGGTFEDGMFEGGTFDGGTFEDGVFDGGDFVSGTWLGGVWNEDRAEWYGGDDYRKKHHGRDDHPNKW